MELNEDPRSAFRKPRIALHAVISILLVLGIVSFIFETNSNGRDLVQDIERTEFQAPDRHFHVSCSTTGSSFLRAVIKI